MAAAESATSEASFGEEVKRLMGLGKRHLVCAEVEQAVKCFEEATQKLDNQYGSGADECGEAYLFYGKALLELARAENGVLGNALKDAEPNTADESSDEDDEADMNAGDDTEEKEKESKDQDKKEGEKDKDTTEASKTEADKASEETSKTEGDKASEGKSETGGDKGAEGSNKTGDSGVEETSNTEQDNSAEGTSKTEGDKATANDGTSETEGKGKEYNAGKSENATPREEADVEMKDEEEKESTENEKAGEQAGENEEADANEEEDEDGEGEDDEEGGEDEGDQEGEGDDGAAVTEGAEEDADVPTMQLAWEILELARLIFVKLDSKEGQLNLSEVHLKLGEIQLEQEQFEGAAKDFHKCLELQKKHLEPDDRLLAETTYSLGLAYSLQTNFAKAKEYYSKALSVIELKTTKLEKRLAESDAKSKGKGKATAEDPCVVDRKELEELQNLYPEIKARVDDAQEMLNSAAIQPECTTEEGFGSSGQDKSGSSVNTIPIKQVSSQKPVTDVSHLVRRKPESTTEEGFGSSGQDKSDIPVNTIPIKQVPSEKPVTDVSHLVRRKRKPEEESNTAADDGEAPVKKARQDDPQPAPVVTENGHAQN